MTTLRPGVIEVIHTSTEMGAWADRGACRGTADSLNWFPVRGDNAMVDACKDLCFNACPVRAECLEHGLRERDGIWGGTSARERRRMLRERGWRLARCERCQVLMMVQRNKQPSYCSDECQERATIGRKREWHRNNGQRITGPQIAANERGRG